MLAVSLFVLALLFSGIHITYKKEWGRPKKAAKTLLSYVLFFSVGVMGILAAYAHVFMGPEIAKEIDWQPDSPFQFEMGMANLSYGVLGICAYWMRGSFWEAECIGWSVLLLGCFVGHMINYFTYGNTAPLNIGVYVWFNDLFLPLFVLGTLFYIRSSRKEAN